MVHGEIGHNWLLIICTYSGTSLMVIDVCSPVNSGLLSLTSVTVIVILA